MDKEKLIYDLALICTKHCIDDNSPYGMEDTVELAIKAFESAYDKIKKSIEPAFERINA